MKAFAQMQLWGRMASATQTSKQMRVTHKARPQRYDVAMHARILLTVVDVLGPTATALPIRPYPHVCANHRPSELPSTLLQMNTVGYGSRWCCLQVVRGSRSSRPTCICIPARNTTSVRSACQQRGPKHEQSSCTVQLPVTQPAMSSRRMPALI